MEDKFPGMWQRWFRHQCVAVGWHSKWGYTLTGPTKRDGWRHARTKLQKIKSGDYVVVALRGHRVGRIGQVTGKAIGDADWDPLVPMSKALPDGEMGRRIFVRWDLTLGPDNYETVVALPPGKQLTTGELRGTIAEVQSLSLEQLRRVMNDSANWIGLLSHFNYERSLSGYIAAYPHHLEDGLLPYPSEKVRERVFRDRTRLDVLLLDRNEVPVIVEAKQGQPTIDDLKQLRRYLELLEQEVGVKPRGILVHGGARKLRKDVASAADIEPRVEVVQYSLNVSFARSN